MTVDVFVCNLYEAAIIGKHFDSVLSVLKPYGDSGLGFTHGDHLFVQFHDTVSVDHGGPTEEQARSIIDWASDRLGNSILVHCAAGMSRSTASALGICVLAGMGEEEALKHVILSRPRPEREFIPNPLLLRHFDKLLGSELLSVVERSEELSGEYWWTTF